MKLLLLPLLLLTACACERENITPLPEPESYFITSNSQHAYDVNLYNEDTGELINLFQGVGAFDTTTTLPDWPKLWLCATTTPMAINDSIWLSIGCVRVQSQGIIIIRYPN
jgi:hypothetical protein